MPTLATAARNAACDAIVDLFDVGGAGSLLIGTTGMASTLATIPLNNPAFGAANTGVATLVVSPAVQDTSADNTGTAAEFQMKSNAGTTLISGTVGVSACDINFNSVSFQAGGVVSITSLTVTVPAS